MPVRVKPYRRTADVPLVKRISPWVIPAVFAAALAPSPDGDTWLFAKAGRVLLSADWSHAFADPTVQVGPLQLVLYGSLGGALGYVVAAAGAPLGASARHAPGGRAP